MASPSEVIRRVGQPLFVGYARVSSVGQDYATQVAALKKAGCTAIFNEKKSGTTTEGRVELQRAIEACQEGDVLMVVRLDRIARSLRDLLAIMQYLDDHGIGFRCLTQPVDTTTSVGRLMTSIIGAVAEFENELRKERIRAGIEAARKAGRFVGRPRLDHSKLQIRNMRWKRKWTPAMIAAKVGCSENYVHKVAPLRKNPYVQPYKARALPLAKKPPNPPTSHLSMAAE